MSTPSSNSASTTLGTFYGRLSDGKSALSTDVDVRLSTTGIDIVERASPYKRDHWPFAALKASEPLRPHAIDVLLKSTTAEGASLFVPDPQFASALLTRAPKLSARAERRRHAMPWLGVIAGIVGLIGALYVFDYSPARTLALSLPDTWRDRLGEQAVESMTESRKVCVEPTGLAALKVLSDRLSAVSAIERPFKVKVYDWSIMNAFAVPGDNVVLTKGMIETVTSADEIAGVLAHEMGHGIELHPETGFIRTVGLAAAVEIMLGGSSGALANMGLLLANLRSTRAAEREADIEGLRLLRQAKISPAGLEQFFERISKEMPDRSDSNTSRALDMFSTHPPTAERRALIAKQATYDATPALDEAQWKALKGICSQTEAQDKKSEPETKDE
jgi:beta-barrel assembly-enhancing protease